jgi:uncharacterized protein YaaN involved in tellurite resistance
MIPVDDATKLELQHKAEAFVHDLSSLDVHDPQFRSRLNDIVTMGDTDIRKSAEVSNRMLQRPAAALAGAKGAKVDAQSRVAGSLAELRQEVIKLDPANLDFKSGKKLLGLIPGSDRIKAYFQKFESAQSQLNAIINALNSGQDELRKDNAAIEGEKGNLWEALGKLNQYAALCAALDSAATNAMPTLPQEKQTAFTSDVLFEIRQKRQDILTQLAVCVQGYLALDMVRKNNEELIKGVKRAETTTVTALRTAVIVAQALANQKLVLDQINAVTTTTSALITSTSQMLQQQGAQIHQQSSSAGVSVEALKTAFHNVFATMDAIDTFKAQAVLNMSQTVDALTEQVGNAQTYLDRARRDERAPESQ